MGELLMYNALNSSFRKVRVPRNPACPVCSDSPTITELIDYNEGYCNLR
jgi:adenylyltransferase/sulfurtransferase